MISPKLPGIFRPSGISLEWIARDYSTYFVPGMISPKFPGLFRDLEYPWNELPGTSPGIFPRAGVYLEWTAWDYSSHVLFLE